MTGNNIIKIILSTLNNTIPIVNLITLIIGIILCILCSKYINRLKKDLKYSKCSLDSLKTTMDREKDLIYVQTTDLRENHFTINFDKKLSLTEQIKLIHEIVIAGEFEISCLIKLKDNSTFHIILDDRNQNSFSCDLNLDFIMMSSKDFDDIIKFRDIINGYITK